MSNFIKKVLGDNQNGTLRRMRRKVKEINKLESTYKPMSDKKLAEQTKVLQKRLEKESLDKIRLVEF